MPSIVILTVDIHAQTPDLLLTPNAASEHQIKGGESHSFRVEITAGNSVRNANLSLNLESRDYDRYRAEIVDPDGNVVCRSGILRPSGKRIGLFFPITKIKSGEYSVRLSGVTEENTTESAADLSFRVIRK